MEVYICEDYTVDQWKGIFMTYATLGSGCPVYQWKGIVQACAPPNRAGARCLSLTDPPWLNLRFSLAQTICES